MTRDATPRAHDVDGLEPVVVEDSCQYGGLMKSVEPLLFPDDDDTDEGQFIGAVLSAVERWFCCSGWPNSINLITIPDSLRRYSLGVVIVICCRYLLHALKGKGKCKAI